MSFIRDGIFNRALIDRLDEITFLKKTTDACQIGTLVGYKQKKK